MPILRGLFLPSSPILLSLLLSAAAGDAPSPSASEMEGAVRDLGSEEMRKRESAIEHLSAWARTSPDEVLRVLPSRDEDPERSAQVERIRKACRWALERRRSMEAIARTVPELGPRIQALYDAPSRRDFQDLHVACMRNPARAEAAASCLVPFLGREETDLRYAALAALTHLRSPPTAPAVAALLEDPDVGIRMQAAASLGQLGNPSVWPALAKALGSDNPSIRIGAIRSLGLLHPREAAGAVALSLEDPDLWVRSMALDALGAIGDPSTSPAVAKQLDFPDPRVKAAAARALGRLGDRSRAGRIRGLLSSDDLETSAAAAEALGALGEREAAGEVAKLLSHEDGTMRLTAIRALGRMGDAALSPALRKLLDDADPKIRIETAIALGRLGERGMSERLVAILQEPEETMQQTTASVRVQTGGGMAVKPILLASSTPGGLRRDAADAIVLLGERSALHRLAPLLSHEEAGVRKAAARAMGGLSGEGWEEDDRAAGAWWEAHRGSCKGKGCPFGCPAQGR